MNRKLGQNSSAREDRVERRWIGERSELRPELHRPEPAEGQQRHGQDEQPAVRKPPGEQRDEEPEREEVEDHPAPRRHEQQTDRREDGGAADDVARRPVRPSQQEREAHAGQHREERRGPTGRDPEEELLTPRRVGKAGPGSPVGIDVGDVVHDHHPEDGQRARDIEAGDPPTRGSPARRAERDAARRAGRDPARPAA